VRRQAAPGRWVDDGPQPQPEAGLGAASRAQPDFIVGAVPVWAALPIVASPWAVPHPHGTPPSRTSEYRRAYEASYRARRARRP
jgi:hypothetical protein